MNILTAKFTILAICLMYNHLSYQLVPEAKKESQHSTNDVQEWTQDKLLA